MSYLSQRKNAGHSNPEVVDFKHLKKYHEHIRHEVQYLDSYGDKTWGSVTFGGVKKGPTGADYLIISNPSNRYNVYRMPGDILTIRSTGKTWA